LAAAIVGIKHPNHRQAYEAFRRTQTEQARAEPDPRA